MFEQQTQNEGSEHRGGVHLIVTQGQLLSLHRCHSFHVSDDIRKDVLHCIWFWGFLASKTQLGHNGHQEGTSLLLVAHQPVNCVSEKKEKQLQFSSNVDYMLQ